MGSSGRATEVRMVAMIVRRSSGAPRTPVDVNRVVCDDDGAITDAR
jgi:hypothetical protein